MRVRTGNREISSEDSLWSSYFRGLYHDDYSDDDDEVNSGQRSDFDSYEVKEQNLGNELNGEHHDDDDDRVSRSGTNIYHSIRDCSRNYHDYGHDHDGTANPNKSLVTLIRHRKLIALIYCFVCILGFYGPKVYNYMNPIVSPKFKVEMASVYAMQIRAHSSGLWNVTISYDVTASWNVNFAFTNPSGKHLFSYSDMVANVHFRPISYPLWVTEIPGFDQEQNSTQFVHLNFERNRVLMEDFAAYRVARDLKHGLSFDFYLRLHGNVTQKSIGYKGIVSAKKRPLDVSCDLDLEFLCKEGNFMALATPTMCKTSSPKSIV